MHLIATVEPGSGWRWRILDEERQEIERSTAGYASLEEALEQGRVRLLQLARSSPPIVRRPRQGERRDVA
jgi:hypothetical protein